MGSLAIPPYRVLHVVTNSSEAYAVEVALSHVRDAAFETERVGRLADAVPAIGARSFDAILVSLDLPDSDGQGVRELIAVVAGRTPVLVLTTAAHEAKALLAVQAGASDYFILSEIGSTMLGRAVLGSIERARSERALRASEDRFRELAELVSEVVWISDTDLDRLIYMSPAWERITGRSRDIICGDSRTLLDVIHPDDRARVAADFEVSPPQGWDREYRIVRPDGTVRWVRDRGYPVYSGDEVVRLTGAFEDITERKAADAHIEMQARMLDAVGEAVIATALDGTISYWNGAAERLYGWTADEVIGRDIATVTVPELAGEQAAEIMRTVRAGLPWSGEFPVRDRSGRVFSALVTNAPFIGADGALLGIIGVSTDLTQIRGTQAALSESEERYRSLFETMGQGVILVGENGRFLEANPAAQATLGMGLEALRERASADDCWRAIREDGSDFPGEERPSTLALRTGQEVTGVVMGVVNAGEQQYRWLLLHAKPHFRPGETKASGVVTTFSDITALRAAEAARAATEERLRLITDTIDEVFYVCEADPPRILYLSPAYERLWGRSPDPLYADSNLFLEAVHPDDLERVAQAIVQRFGHEEVYCEYRIIRPDGEVRWIADRSYPLESGNGLPGRVVGSAQDITERKDAAELLRGKEERLSRIVDTVAEAIVIVGLDGTINFANRAAECILGLAPSDIVDRPFDDVAWHIESVEGGPMPRDRLPIARVLASGVPVTGVENAIAWPDGRRIIVSVNAAPLRGTDGEVEGVVATARDVTAAREAAARIRFQATLLDAIGEAVAATDVDGRILYWNRRSEVMIGWKSDEVVGSPMLEVVASPESASVIRSALAATVRGRETAGELLLQRRNGETFPAFVNAAPVFNDAGEVVGVVTATTDLTELKHLQLELQQSQRMEAVGRLAGGVAHDFNNILTGIQGYTEFILDELNEADPLRPDVLEIKGAADRAAGLTRQLLAFSRKQVLQPRVLDLGTVIRGMEKMFGRLIGEDIDLAFSYDEELGRVLADPTQIEQVILNLAVNARDAMPKGGRLRIELRNVPASELSNGTTPRQYVSLRVTDTGSGIPDAILPHVFEPFYTTKPTGEGTGLGLSTVYGIITQSGGTIDVESAVGEGTAFDIRFPTVDEAVQEIAATATVLGGARGETVLLVEDEDVLRALGVRILRRLGYVVLDAKNGVEALAASERHAGTIDLLLTDVIMPEMSGTELAERLVLLRPGLRVLFVSGYTEDFTSRHGALKAGQSLLDKPFTPSSLGRRVREVLDGVGGPAA